MTSLPGFMYTSSTQAGRRTCPVCLARAGVQSVIVWDDGGAERLDGERKAWETLNVSVLWHSQLCVC